MVSRGECTVDLTVSAERKNFAELAREPATKANVHKAWRLAFF